MKEQQTTELQELNASLLNEVRIVEWVTRQLKCSLQTEELDEAKEAETALRTEVENKESESDQAKITVSVNYILHFDSFVLLLWILGS